MDRLATEALVLKAAEAKDQAQASPTPENHARALKTIPAVKLPRTDPVMGAEGPLVKLWKPKC